MDTAIQKAIDRITFVANDMESLRAYEMREMAISDFTSGMNFARKEGIAIGEERGIAIGEERGIALGEERGIAIGDERATEKTRKEEQIKYAVKLAKNGWTIVEIADFTDLPIEEVKTILKQNNLL
jgi:predicted transposase YdaD